MQTAMAMSDQATREQATPNPLPDLRQAARAEALLSTFDRVLWQRIRVAPDGLVAEVHGTRRRHPASLSIPLDSALAVAAAGVPTVVTRGATP